MTTTPDEPQVPSGDPADATPPPQAPPAPPAPARVRRHTAAAGLRRRASPGLRRNTAARLHPPPGGYAPQPAYAAAPGAPLSDSDQRLWATLSHVGGILFWFVPSLVIWLVFKGRGQFVEEQAKEALNFQILLTIAYVVGWITSFIGIGILILVAVGIGGLVFMILAGIAANKGVAYRYPITLRLIK